MTADHIPVIQVVDRVNGARHDAAVMMARKPKAMCAIRARFRTLRALAFGLSLAAVGAAPAQEGGPMVPVIVRAIAGGIEARRGAMLTRVVALSPGVVRIRIAPSGTMPEDASWAVDAAKRAHPVAVTATAGGFETASIVVRIDPADGRLTIADRQGRPILADRVRTTVRYPPGRQRISRVPSQVP